MSFTRMANAERKLIQADNVAQRMASYGWCETHLPVRALQRLSIPHEVSVSPTAAQGSLNTPGNAVVYAPAWVYAILRRTPPGTRLSTVETRLVATRDDPREQEQVTTELLLDPALPRSLRDAVHNFRYKRP